MRRPFQCHRTTDMNVGSVDFIFAETKMFQHVKIKIIQLCVADSQLVFAEIGPKGELIEGKFDIKGTAKSGFDFINFSIAKAFVFQRIDRH